MSGAPSGSFIASLSFSPNIRASPEISLHPHHISGRKPFFILLDFNLEPLKLSSTLLKKPPKIPMLWWQLFCLVDLINFSKKKFFLMSRFNQFFLDPISFSNFNLKLVRSDLSFFLKFVLKF